MAGNCPNPEVVRRSTEYFAQILTFDPKSKYRISARVTGTVLFPEVPGLDAGRQ
jgi:hypothetical protein